MPRVYEPLVLEIEPPYIGSAVSPTVEITETSEDVTVTITDVRGDHSYTVDKTDQAIADAEAAAANANAAASTATAKGQQAVDIATTAAANADAKAALAESAASTAATAAENADDAASDARAAMADTQAATQAANAATSNAQAATSTANTAAQNADAKATLANTAASNADAKAALANTAAANADAKATLADNAATSANAAAAQASTSAANADTSATAANTAAATADAAREAIQDDLAAKADADGYYPLLGAGTSDALMSTDATVDTFAQRTSDHDGGVRVESLRGRTVVWNQLVPVSGRQTVSTVVFNTSDYIFENHKYLIAVNAVPTESATNPLFTLYGRREGDSDNITLAYLRVPSTGRYTQIFTSQATLHGGSINTAGYFWLYTWQIAEWENFVLYDLTSMFGAGNEPATVAEFEAIFPEIYYPYDAGSLLSVNIEGVKSVGKNLLGAIENGSFDANGINASSANRCRSTEYIAVESGATYVLQASSTVGKVIMWAASFYTVNDFATARVTTTDWLLSGRSATVPLGAKYMRVLIANTDNSNCTVDSFTNRQLERGSIATPYEPYREITREIPPSTLFPDGILRSAGSAYDERTPTKDVKRIGVVDLGSLHWTMGNATQDGLGVVFYTDSMQIPVVQSTSNINCAMFTPHTTVNPWEKIPFGNIAISGTRVIIGGDSGYTDANAFKAAMSGVMFYYELATPTETPIDPPLNLAYPTEQGGTESIIIPEGSQSAAPTMAIVYAYNADGVRDISQAIIATIEGATASINYTIGGYFVHGGELYRATSAIATGETINPGTNCVATTVMAEIVRLTA